MYLFYNYEESPAGRTLETPDLEKRYTVLSKVKLSELMMRYCCVVPKSSWQFARHRTICYLNKQNRSLQYTITANKIVAPSNFLELRCKICTVYRYFLVLKSYDSVNCRHVMTEDLKASFDFKLYPESYFMT